MDLIFLLVFWGLILGLWLQKKIVYSRNRFSRSCPNNPKSVFNNYGSIIRRCRWIYKPGWFVTKMTNESQLKRDLRLARIILSVNDYLAIKQVICFLGMCYFWGYLWFGEVNWKQSFLLLGLFVVIYVVPDLWVRRNKIQQMQKFSQEVPYFIDLLALILQTGLNIQQSLTYVSQNKQGSIALVVRENLQLLNLGKSLESVLLKLRSEIPVPEWNHFLSSIIQSKQLGVSLSDTLEIQSRIIRTKRRQKAEELSRTAAVKISLPLVLFIFPALLILYIGPGIIYLVAR